jgi:hypothetical protein
MLAVALEAEVEAYIATHAKLVDAATGWSSAAGTPGRRLHEPDPV